MEHKGTKTIETERLLLRQFNENDADAMFRNWESDDKVTEFLRWKTVTDISTAEQILCDWIQEYNNSDFYQWAIVLKEIEACTLYKAPSHFGNCDLCYALHRRVVFSVLGSVFYSNYFLPFHTADDPFYSFVSFLLSDLIFLV